MALICGMIVIAAGTSKCSRKPHEGEKHDAE
jgi:hypothetical protein